MGFLRVYISRVRKGFSMLRAARGCTARMAASVMDIMKLRSLILSILAEGIAKLVEQQRQMSCASQLRCNCKPNYSTEVAKRVLPMLSELCFCLTLLPQFPWRFLQPGKHSFVDPCTSKLKSPSRGNTSIPYFFPGLGL